MSDFTLTAGFFDYGAGDNVYGFVLGSFGALSPGTISGQTVKELNTSFTEGVFATGLVVAGSQLQSLFTSITANSITLNSADASYSVVGSVPPITIWSWPAVVMFDAATSYPVTISGGTPEAVTAGTVTSAAGSGTITRSDGTVISLGTAAAITVGDSIVAGGVCRAEIVMGDGTVVTVEPGSHLVVQSYSYTPGLSLDSDSLIVRVIEGALRIVTGLIGRAVNIITPAASFAMGSR